MNYSWSIHEVGLQAQVELSVEFFLLKKVILFEWIMINFY